MRYRLISLWLALSKLKMRRVNSEVSARSSSTMPKRSAERKSSGSSGFYTFAGDPGQRLANRPHIASTHPSLLLGAEATIHLPRGTTRTFTSNWVSVSETVVVVGLGTELRMPASRSSILAFSSSDDSCEADDRMAPVAPAVPFM